TSSPPGVPVTAAPSPASREPVAGAASPPPSGTAEELAAGSPAVSASTRAPALHTTKGRIIRENPFADPSTHDGAQPPAPSPAMPPTAPVRKAKPRKATSDEDEMYQRK